MLTVAAVHLVEFFFLTLTWIWNTLFTLRLVREPTFRVLLLVLIILSEFRSELLIIDLLRLLVFLHWVRAPAKRPP